MLQEAIVRLAVSRIKAEAMAVPAAQHVQGANQPQLSIFEQVPLTDPTHDMPNPAAIVCHFRA